MIISYFGFNGQLFVIARFAFGFSEASEEFRLLVVDDEAISRLLPATLRSRLKAFARNDIGHMFT